MYAHVCVCASCLLEMEAPWEREWDAAQYSLCVWLQLGPERASLFAIFRLDPVGRAPFLAAPHDWGPILLLYGVVVRTHLGCLVPLFLNWPAT